MSQNVPTTATTAAVTVQTPPVNAPATPPQRSSGEQRAAAIKAQLTAMEEAGETEPKDAKPSAAKPKPAAKTEKPAGLESAKPEPKEAPELERVEAAPEKDDDSEEEERARAKKESEARLARINAVRAKEQAAREENARRRQAKRPPAPAAAELAELETLRKRVAELEPESKAFSSPMELLEWAERKGLGSVDLANALRQRLTDPNAIAQQHSRTLEERLRAEHKAEIAQIRADQEKLVQRLAEEKRAAREEAEAIAKTNDFLSRVKESESHPRTARLFRKDQGLFLNWINEQVVAHLPRGYTVDHLHDVTEQYLEWLQDGGDEASTAANGASRPPKNGAAKPVTTLSNALTSGRNAVTEDKPLHLLSKKEREARLKAMLERE